jgi:hypothetical protein
MAWVRCVREDRRWPLQTETLIGRSKACSLVLPENYVSMQHACFRWSGTHWLLRDLGSRNGTFLGGAALRSQDWHDVHAGVQVAFGHPSEVWALEDEAPPEPMLVPLSGGPPRVVEADHLALPDEASCEATLLRDDTGRWWLETPEHTTARAVHDQEAFEVGKESFRFHLPVAHRSTEPLDAGLAWEDILLEFLVSRDEEHVELVLHWHGRQTSLGSRAHHYLLLELARRRVSDQSANVPEPSCGWVYHDELSRALRMDEQKVNLEVFRLRQQFAKLNLREPMRVVERRPRTRQLRIGAAALRVRSA